MSTLMPLNLAMTGSPLREGRRTASKAVGCMLGVLVAYFLVSGVAAAETYAATPSDYLGLLRKLRPGDTLALAPGRYLNGLPVHGLVGSPDKPIVIRGPRSQPSARFVARPTANTVNIRNSAYVEIRNLELDGNGLAVAAVRGDQNGDWAHHITLDNLYIHGHDADQQAVGISSFCPSWGWVIKNNVIVGAGTGVYLGNSDGSAPFVGGIIEHNLIIDSIGYNLQIKHQKERPAIKGMPEGTSVTIIRHNVFSKSPAKSSGGDLARPNLLVGHWPPSGPGVDDTYAIYGNFFFQNPSEALFQGEGNFAFYSNIMVNSYGDAIHIQPHNAIPRRIDVFHNTILASDTGIRIAGGDPAFARRVRGNVVFAHKPIIGGEQHANVTGQMADASNYLIDPLSSLGQLDLAPRPDKLVVAPFEYQPQIAVPEFNRDFDRNIYLGPVSGAYAAEVARWRLRLEIKPDQGASERSGSLFGGGWR